MLHARNLDWAVPGIGPATIVLNYRGLCCGKHDVISVAWPGYLGIVSGMVKGVYSGTLNQAPNSDKLRVGCVPVSFALRHIMERCDTFDGAVQVLKTTELMSSGLFLHAGTDEAAVVEHDGKEGHETRGKALAVTNDYISAHARRKYGYPNVSEDGSDSCERLRQARSILKRCYGPDDVLVAMAQSPVRNSLTAQQMVFEPKSGNFEVGTYATDAAVLGL